MNRIVPILIAGLLALSRSAHGQAHVEVSALEDREDRTGERDEPPPKSQEINLGTGQMLFLTQQASISPANGHAFATATVQKKALKALARTLTLNEPGGGAMDASATAQISELLRLVEPGGAGFNRRLAINLQFIRQHCGEL